MAGAQGRRSEDPGERARPAPAVARTASTTIEPTTTTSAAAAAAGSERLLRLQRQAGNGAVTGLVVQRKAVAHTPAKQVPGLLADEPLVAQYVGKGGGKALKVKVLTRPEMAKAYMAYALKQGISEKDARAKAGITAAFTNLETGQIYLDKERGDPGTIVHEALHLRSSKDFVQTVHPKVNEGTTELFTRRVCEKGDIARTQDEYVPYMTAVEKLLSKSSVEALAAAYFLNDTTKLVADLEAVRPGLWTDWQREIAKSAIGSIAFLEKLGS